MLLEDIKKQLQDRNLRAVSRKIGVNHNTLCNIANGKVTNPSYRTFELIKAYLEGSENASKK